MSTSSHVRDLDMFSPFPAPPGHSADGALRRTHIFQFRAQHTYFVLLLLCFYPRNRRHVCFSLCFLLRVLVSALISCLRRGEPSGTLLQVDIQFSQYHSLKRLFLHH